MDPPAAARRIQRAFRAWASDRHGDITDAGSFGLARGAKVLRLPVGALAQHVGTGRLRCPLTGTPLDRAELLRLDHAARRFHAVEVSGWFQARATAEEAAEKSAVRECIRELSEAILHWCREMCDEAASGKSWRLLFASTQRQVVGDDIAELTWMDPEEADRVFHACMAMARASAHGFDGMLSWWFELSRRFQLGL